MSRNSTQRRKPSTPQQAFASWRCCRGFTQSGAVGCPLDGKGSEAVLGNGRWEQQGEVAAAAPPPMLRSTSHAEAHPVPPPTALPSVQDGAAAAAGSRAVQRMLVWLPPAIASAHTLVGSQPGARAAEFRRQQPQQLHGLAAVWRASRARGGTGGSRVCGNASSGSRASSGAACDRGASRGGQGSTQQCAASYATGAAAASTRVVAFPLHATLNDAASLRRFSCQLRLSQALPVPPSTLCQLPTLQSDARFAPRAQALLSQKCTQGART